MPDCFLLEHTICTSNMVDTKMAPQSSKESPSASVHLKADADWYDEFYKKPQVGLAPWYRFLLPELSRTVKPPTKLIELGCGQAHILRILAQTNALPQENITGLDQSKVAVD